MTFGLSSPLCLGDKNGLGETDKVIEVAIAPGGALAGFFRMEGMVGSVNGNRSVGWETGRQFLHYKRDEKRKKLGTSGVPVKGLVGQAQEPSLNGRSRNSRMEGK